jgi:outer membrane protein OmpA-like peptidoglycan-associated protein
MTLSGMLRARWTFAPETLGESKPIVTTAPEACRVVIRRAVPERGGTDVTPVEILVLNH